MTRKTRSSKPGGDEASKQEPKDGAAATESTTSQDNEESASKVTLPAFGFAEDLLKADPPSKPPAEEAVPSVPAQEVDGDDPRRIFAFADGLQQGASEPQAAPVRLETWVAFSLAGEVFALPVAPVREVVRVDTITRVPHAPKPIRGVTNRRGRVIPVIDLRLRIELPSAELGRASRVIVVSSRGRLLGLLVDAVHQVIHINLEQVQPPPDDVMTVQSDYLSGVYHLDDQLVLLLDIDRALIIQAAPEPGARSAAGPDKTDTAAQQG